MPSIKQTTLLSICFFTLTGIFSSGFQHFDEHFQIIEFMNLKLGGTNPSNLAWEYREKIRPWLQPFIYFYIKKVLFLNDPFFTVTIFRILTALLGLFSLYQFIPVLKKWFQGRENEKYVNLSFALMTLSWFAPYIFSRTSSESFGISFFMLGTSLFLTLEDKNNKAIIALLTGFLWAMSYQSRFQMAAMVAPLWFWALIFKKHRLSWLALSALGVILGIGLGVLIDYWGYGSWNFSLWHYFRTNFLEGIIVRLQQYPFWWYVRLAFNRGIPPISLILIISTFWGWYKLRKHPLTWMTLPLFIFYSSVGHKELRFIFPIIILSPIFLTFFIKEFSYLFEKKILKVFTKIILFINVALLIIISFRAANPSVKFYKFIYNKDFKTIYAKDENPFTMLGLPLKFYEKKGLEVIVYKNQLDDFKDKILFFKSGADIFKMEKDHPECKMIYTSYPRFTLDFNIGNWISRSRVWSLYDCPS